MKERSSGNDVIKSSFDAKIADILERLEVKADRTEVEQVQEVGEAARISLELRLTGTSNKLAEEQEKFASIVASVEESIKEI
jgi:hypothetical protein